MKIVDHFHEGQLHRIPIQDDSLAEILEQLSSLENHPSKKAERSAKFDEAFAKAGADDRAWKLIAWMHERFTLDCDMPIAQSKKIIRLHRGKSS